MILSWKVLLGGFALLIALVAGGIWAGGRAIKQAVQDEHKLDSLHAVIVLHDTTYKTDTTKLRVTRTAYDTLRRRLVITDTIRVREVLAAADSVINQCKLTIMSCEQRVRDRDALITELSKKKPSPRLTFEAKGLYDPFHAESILRAGSNFRLVWGVSATGELEFNQPRGFAGRFGFKKEF